MTNLPVNTLSQYNISGPIDGSPSTSPVVGQELSDRTMAILGFSDGNFEDVQEEATFGSTTSIESAKAQYTSMEEVIIQQAITNGTASLEEIQQQVLNSREKRVLMTGSPDFFAEQAMGVLNPEMSPTDVTYATNMQIAEQEFLSAIEGTSNGVLGTALQFIDRYFIRALPIGALEDLSFQSERSGRKLLQAAMTMDPTAYRAFIKEYIAEAREEGFFLDDNFFAVQEAFEDATNAGYDPMAGVNAAMGAVDMFGVGKAITGTARVVRGTARAFTQADNIVTRTVATSGQEAGAEVGAKIVTGKSPPDTGVVTAMGPELLDVGSSTTRPQTARMTEITEGNTVWNGIVSLLRGGSFGRVAGSTEVLSIAQKTTRGYLQRVGNSMNAMRVSEDVAGNPVLVLDLGNNKAGTAFRSDKNANKSLTNMDVPNAKVVQLDETDPSKGFVIRVEERLNLEDAVKPFDTTEVEMGFIKENFSRIFGANTTLDNVGLSALANMGEAGVSAVIKQVKPLVKSINKVSRESRGAILGVFKELRDGADAHLKSGYTIKEFEQAFKNSHPRGLAPTQKDIEAFRAINTIEDAAWLMRANEQLIKYTRDGYWSINIDGYGRVVGKRVTDTDLYPDIPKEMLGLKGTSIWKLDYPTRNGDLYVMNPSSVDILSHTDVLGFNSGGRRINPHAKYFLSFKGDTPRAFLTAFSEKQARLALEELSNIRRVIKDLGDDLTLVGRTDELDDLISRNNTWNPSIETWEDFAKISKENRWDWSKEIGYKARNEEMVEEVAIVHRGTVDTYVIKQLSRSDEVLMDFGGGAAYNINPIDAILKDFQNAASHFTHRAYSFNAAGAWVKRARIKGSGVKLASNIPANDFLLQLQHAEITGTNQAARRLRHQRSVIRRRLHMKGPVQERFASFGQEMSEFVFDKAGIKTDFKDPSNALLNIGFQSAFGFGAVSQFFMQGAHAMAVVAVSPTQGLRAAGSVLPLMLAIRAPTKEARLLALQRLSKFMGETTEDLEELVDYLYTSGRDIVDGGAIELGTGPSFGVSRWGGNNYLPSAIGTSVDKITNGGRKALEAGLIPFRAGERLGRMTGITASFFEFKRAFPGVSALSDEGRRWITTREQNISFNMTAASRPLFQAGPMKVPTQWLSYTFRAMEAVTVGRGFTAAERARLAMVLGPMYGLTGMGLASASEYLVEKFGIQDEGTYVAMKYGIIDWLVHEYTPVNTSVATRLAPITGITDLVSNVIGGEASFLEVVAGPSGSITGGIVKSLWGAVSELVNGNTVSLTEDALLILRQPSGLDAIAKGLGILNNGYYRSKTGTVLPFEMSTSDAILSFTGFAPLEVAEYWDARSSAFTNARHYRAFRKEMVTDFRRAIDLYSTDPDKGLRMLREVNTKIALSGFSLEQQMGLRSSLGVEEGRAVYDMSMDLMKRGLRSNALLLETIFGDS